MSDFEQNYAETFLNLGLFDVVALGLGVSMVGVIVLVNLVGPIDPYPMLAIYALSCSLIIWVLKRAIKWEKRKAEKKRPKPEEFGLDHSELER